MDAHRLAGLRHGHRLVIDLHRVDVLREVAGVALDVDRVAHGQRVVLDFDCRHADLGKVMRDFAQFHFCHRTALLW